MNTQELFGIDVESLQNKNVEFSLLCIHKNGIFDTEIVHFVNENFTEKELAYMSFLFMKEKTESILVDNISTVIKMQNDGTNR